MTRLAEIEAHIVGMSELADIIGAMRSLAGMRLLEAQQALPGIHRYQETIAAGIADTLMLLGEPVPSPADGTTAIVLCTAEHGFVGGFNERLVDAGKAALRPGAGLFVLGSRGAVLAAERGSPPAWSMPMAIRSATAPNTVQVLVAELYRRIAKGEISRVEVIAAQRSQGEPERIEKRLLLPLDVASLTAHQASQPPLTALDPSVLYERLLAEHVFALLTRATVGSIAAENAARLAAMEAAHDNVAHKLESLQAEARQARQDEITTEILDLVRDA